jgi:hypothetical protein
MGKRCLQVVMAICVAACFSSCGGSTGPELAPVSGTVTFNGNPLADATVIFQPETGRPSIGKTSSSGVYTLLYTRNAKGALPGKHTVAIRTRVEDENGNVTVQEYLPEIYNAKTTLTATVEPKSNVIDFDLTGEKR